LPTDTEALELRSAGGEDAHALTEAADLADTLGDLIVHRLTSHQREVLVGLAIDGVDPKDLADRLGSTTGALYKTLHDARSELKRELAGEQRSDRHQSFRSRSPSDRAEAARWDGGSESVD
jgi:DNA-directed RNA polymerase specialized sigma24 family protein